MKWTKPGKHKYGTGWIVSSLNGEPAFSDGHAMFLGERRSAKDNKSPDFDATLRKLLPKAGLRKIRSLTSESGHWTGSPQIVMDGMRINKMYVRFARKFKGVEFYRGNKAVICKVGRKVVGAIMEMVW